MTFVDDGDAEKLTNRCFKLAEIFIRQRQRRSGANSGPSSPEERRRDDSRMAQAQPVKQEPQTEESPVDASNEEDGD